MAATRIMGALHKPQVVPREKKCNTNSFRKTVRIFINDDGMVTVGYSL